MAAQRSNRSAQGHRGKPSKDVVRSALIDAADRLLQRHGYGKLTMDGIAVEAGLSRRTVYEYFRNREEIARTALERGLDALIVHLQQFAEGSGDPVARISRLLVERVHFVSRNAKERHFSYDEVIVSMGERYLEMRLAYLEREADLLAAVIAEGQARGEIRPGDSRHLARCLLAATSSFMPFAQTKPGPGNTEAMELQLDTVVNLLARGLVLSPRVG